ncbi:MAG: GAF domain-containing protein [Candidatus Promineifilaceae bacterium]|nr:GAF domain-containing protein [Candidatus Promineifilaceae bacterium]
MLERISQILAVPPIFAEDERDRARLLNVLLWSIAIFAPVITLSITVIEGQPLLNLTSIIGLSVSALMLALQVLLRRGQLVLASWFASLGLLVAVTYTIYAFNGIRDTTTIVLAFVIVIAGLLLNDRLSIAFFTAATVAAVAGVYYAETLGLVTYDPDQVGIDDVVSSGATLVLIGALLAFAVRNLNDALQRARRSEAESEKANEQLEALNEELEARVASRTRALQLSADVSRRLSTILDKDELISEIVNQLQRSFDYYHVHIYLLDENGAELVLAGGTGEPAQRMLEQGHRIAVGRGLVGRAAERKLPVLVPDVSQDPGWLPNPLLPDTATEAAVPIVRGDRVLGVLDVQDDTAGRLTDEDVELLKAIVNQVAVALQNADLYEQAQRRAQQEVLLNLINQKIQDTTSVEQAVQVAVRELGRALDGSPTYVKLDPGNGRSTPQTAAETGV